MKRALFCLGFTLLLAACDFFPRELRMHLPGYRLSDLEALQLVFSEESPVELTFATGDSTLSALAAITSRTADLALVENSAAFERGVRAVLPLFRSVLHIAVREGFMSADPALPMLGATIYITDQSSAGHSFVDVFTRRIGIGAGDFAKVAKLTPGQTDIIIHFGPVSPDHIDWLPPGYRLVSLGGEINRETGFIEEGISYVVPKMSPSVIPAGTYRVPGNELPLKTIGVDTLLITHEDVPLPLVYMLTLTLLEQKPRLMAISPSLFSGINESFDPLDLSFPLHAGARRYLERDEPGLLERYAETINTLLYLAVLSATGFFAFARWRSRRSRDRIDRFYLRALGIQERIGGEAPASLLAELIALEQEAFHSLLDSKLAADESFRIFTDLISRVRGDIGKSADGANTDR
jgi:hypothetical protein